MAGFPQTVVNGIINGSFVALLTLGFGLIFGTTGRFHWAMSVSLTYAALVTAVLSTSGRLWFPIALIVGLLAGVIIGVAIELLAYRPLVARSVGPAFLAVDSWGLPSSEKTSRGCQWAQRGLRHHPGAQGKTIGPLIVSLSSFDTYSVLVVWVVVAIVWFTLNRTGLGRQIRAVRVNALMARVVGISPESVFVTVFAMGSILAGISGVLSCIRVAVLPDMGTIPMLFAFVAAFVAGTQSGVLRFAIAGLLIGLVQSISTNWLAIIWSPVVVFAILFLYVAFRPVVQSSRFRSSKLGKRLNASGRWLEGG